MHVTLPPPIVVVDAPAATSSAGPHAFTRSTPQGTWAAFPVTLVPARDAPVDALAATLDVAGRAWRAAPCASLSFRVAAPAVITAGDDGVNVVVFETKTWPADLLPGVAAQTVLRVDASGHFRDVDIHLNAVDFTFGADDAPGTVDLRGVLTHELGHVLGLGHSEDTLATMFASTSDLATWRSLEGDDVLGACTLYPGTGALACSDADPCPSSFVCLAARCERPNDARATCAPCHPDDAVTCAPNGAAARCSGEPLESGATAYRCARPCERDEECGAGFRCQDTTSAGNRQCVGGCSGAGYVVPARPNAGASRDAGADGAAPNPSPPSLEPGGCDVGAPASRSGSIFALLVVLAALIRTRAHGPS